MGETRERRKYAASLTDKLMRFPAQELWAKDTLYHWMFYSASYDGYYYVRADSAETLWGLQDDPLSSVRAHSMEVLADFVEDRFAYDLFAYDWTRFESLERAA